MISGALNRSEGEDAGGNEGVDGVEGSEGPGSDASSPASGLPVSVRNLAAQSICVHLPDPLAALPVHPHTKGQRGGHVDCTQPAKDQTDRRIEYRPFFVLLFVLNLFLSALALWVFVY